LLRGISGKQRTFFKIIFGIETPYVLQYGEFLSAPFVIRLGHAVPGDFSITNILVGGFLLYQTGNRCQRFSLSVPPGDNALTLIRR